MKMIIRNYVFVMLIIVLPGFSLAATPHWKIVPNESTLTFTATQNDAPVTGKFKTFSGEINFDPAQLNASNVHIIVDMNSLSTSYDDLTTTLMTPDWLNIKIFPN